MGILASDIKKIYSEPGFFIAIFHKDVTFPSDALTTERGPPLGAAPHLFLASAAGQGDADMNNTKTSLPVAILSFAFTGIFGPHRRKDEYLDPPRNVSSDGKGR